jgi:hypothetical protein
VILQDQPFKGWIIFEQIERRNAPGDDIVCNILESAGVDDSHAAVKKIRINEMISFEKKKPKIQAQN